MLNLVFIYHYAYYLFIFASKFLFYFKITIVMREIEIKVFRFVVGKEKVVFCRRVTLVDDHIFPFALIKSALEVLFGKDYFISFMICPNE